MTEHRHPEDWDGEDRRIGLPDRRCIDCRLTCDEHKDLLIKLTELTSNLKWFMRFGKWLLGVCGTVLVILLPVVITIVIAGFTMRSDIRANAKDIEHHEAAMAETISSVLHLIEELSRQQRETQKQVHENEKAIMRHSH